MPAGPWNAGWQGGSASSAAWQGEYRYKGRVTQMKPLQGYGFITAHEPIPGKGSLRERKIFFHFSKLVPPWSIIRYDDYVDFTIGADAKGRHALGVRRLSWY